MALVIRLHRRWISMFHRPLPVVQRDSIFERGSDARHPHWMGRNTIFHCALDIHGQHGGGPGPLWTGERPVSSVIAVTGYK
jgi:hypothetical protein